MSLGAPALTTLAALHTALATTGSDCQAAAAEVEVRRWREREGVGAPATRKKRQMVRGSPPSLPPLRPAATAATPCPPSRLLQPTLTLQSIEARTAAAVAQAEHPIAKR